MKTACLPAFQHLTTVPFDPPLAMLGWWSAGIGVVLGMTLVLLFVGVWRLWNRRLRETSCHPRRLFSELGRAHGLTASQQRLLWRVARQMRVAEPALIFVNPSLLEGAIQNRTLAEGRETLTAVQKLLFATSETATAAGTPRR